MHTDFSSVREGHSVMSLVEGKPSASSKLGILILSKSWGRAQVAGTWQKIPEDS